MKKILTLFLAFTALCISAVRGQPGGNHIDISNVVFEKQIATKDSAKAHKGYITANAARKMSVAYKNDKQKSRINGDSKRNDATAIWFDLNTLEEFIKTIKDSTRNSTCQLQLGVRIYYAKYPVKDSMSSTSYKGLSSDVAQHHTLFLVPTYYNDSLGMDVDFSFDHVGNKCKPTLYYQVIQSQPFAPISILGSVKAYRAPTGNRATAREVVQNHGGLSPPNGAGTFPTPSAPQP